MAAAINQAVHFSQEDTAKQFRVLRTNTSERIQAWSRWASFVILLMPLVPFAVIPAHVSEPLPPSALCVQIFFQVVISLVFFWKFRVFLRHRDGLTYALGSGFLVARLDDSRDLFRVDLSKVSRVEIVDGGNSAGLQLRLIARWKVPVDVPTLEDMEEFVAAVAAHVPVEIERRSRPMPKRKWMMLVVLSLLVLSSVVLLAFFYGLTLLLD